MPNHHLHAYINSNILIACCYLLYFTNVTMLRENVHPQQKKSQVGVCFIFFKFSLMHFLMIDMFPCRLYNMDISIDEGVYHNLQNSHAILKPLNSFCETTFLIFLYKRSCNSCHVLTLTSSATNDTCD